MDAFVTVLDGNKPSSKKTKTTSRSAIRRLTGVYYTPSPASDFMADWIVRREGEQLLEPSFGDGVFLRSVAKSKDRRKFEHLEITGIEIDKSVKENVQENLLDSNFHLLCADFLKVTPFPVHGIIGNPPYVRLRNLPDDQREKALDIAGSALGQPMEPSGSIWMPFVLHAMRFLVKGGRMAFVLPYEFSYVRYARPLWDVLSDNFGSLKVIRTHERLFPDILQEVVILLADDFGSRSDCLLFEAFEQVTDVLANCPLVSEKIKISDLLRGQRPFVKALLGEELRELLHGRVADVTAPARSLVTFNIGYVTGDKNFFHPTADVISKYNLPKTSTHPALTSTRALRGVGLDTSSLNVECMDRLFMPSGDLLTANERKYVDWGEKNGVASRYKCQVRDPWFIVPGVRVPGLVLSVFSERPVLLVNDAQYFASNSLLCGFSESLAATEIVTRWYTSLTLLQCELQVHALGGGVMVLIPGEVGNILLPKKVLPRQEHLSHLDSLLKQGKTDEAYKSGDQVVLVDQLGFSQDDLLLIESGIAVLTHWRTSSRSSLGLKQPMLIGEV